MKTIIFCALLVTILAILAGSVVGTVADIATQHHQKLADVGSGVNY